jgi:RNA-directed DNA polymerase
VADPAAQTALRKSAAPQAQATPDAALCDTAPQPALPDSATRRWRLTLRQQAAAQRRAQRAAAIAHRRANDIVYLGRGVSRGLSHRQSDAARLQQYNLPVLTTPADVAQALGITVPQLRWLCFHREAAQRIHYTLYFVPKRSGGTRQLAAPHRTLARCQRWVLQHILAQLPAADAAHGFVAGRSTRTNAAPHVGQDVVVNLDLCDFFPSITFVRVRGAFHGLGYSLAAATLLALLCTEAPRLETALDVRRRFVAQGPRCLPQGACTSPALSNWIARRLDARLSGLASILGWNYTRYADDLTFSTSGDAAARVGYLLARVRHIAADEGFAVNEPKTRVLRRHTAQTVTGVVVNDRPGVPRGLVRRLRAILHHARREGLASQNRAGHRDFESWLRGMIAYVAMINPEQGARLQQALQQVRHD